MRKFSLLAVLLATFLAAAMLHAETADDFLKAYFLIQEGDAADKGAETAKAVEKYSGALKILRAIKQSDPNWNPNIIAYRTKWCAEHILKNGGAVPPEEAAPPPDAAVPTSAAPAGAPTGPISTVPKDAVPETTTVEESPVDARVQALLKENSELKQRLNEAELKLKSVPTASENLSSLKAELVRAQADLQSLKKENEELKSANASLKNELEEVRTQLKTATSTAASDVAPEVLQTLKQENAVLRSIVDRQYEEDAKRTAARDKVTKELEELSARAESIKEQLTVLQSPLTPLTEDEKKLLRTPPTALRTGADDPNKLSAVLKADQGSDSGQDANLKLTGDNASLAAEAKTLFAGGDMEGAAAKYEKIIASEPRSLFAMSNLGVIRFRQERLEDAEKALRGALAVNSQDAFSLSILGLVLYKQEKLDDAIGSLSQAVAIEPKNSDYHNHLGITYTRKGYLEAAEKELLKAIELKPDFADAHFNLAVAYATQTPPSAGLARNHYKKAIDLGMAKDPELEKLLRK